MYFSFRNGLVACCVIFFACVAVFASSSRNETGIVSILVEEASYESLERELTIRTSFSADSSYEVYDLTRSSGQVASTGCIRSWGQRSHHVTSHGEQAISFRVADDDNLKLHVRSGQRFSVEGTGAIKVYTIHHGDHREPTKSEERFLAIVCNGTLQELFEE